METASRYPVRLTELAHGGGCGCKLAPSVLHDILAKIPVTDRYPSLLVGTETSDDAAVYRLSDTQALVATTDFFMPIVDDPFDFGRIAATNALSDVYAMGGTPVMALAIVGMPVGKIPLPMVQDILAGGAAVCAEAGVPIAGGHSIDCPEPVYGLAAMGLVDPRRILRNSTARPGDSLILAKRLGIGIFSAALKRGELDGPGYAEMLESTTQLNAVGAELRSIAAVSAVTDVTGFGLLGHTLEMCRGAGIGVRIAWDRLPIFPAALRFAEAGIGTGASTRNWDSYGHDADLPPGMSGWQRTLLCDPQTSGGLLIACGPDGVDVTLDLLRERGFVHASIIGAFVSGAPRVSVS
ncbi:MAG TPA: selenide, water dikinase SelD [Alphaproteobacteria bacterium]|jgi:selenide,water dikinase|nr:selenide, water dikinase SelD [Alphaproteobacteria bacterium]